MNYPGVRRFGRPLQNIYPRECSLENKTPQETTSKLPPYYDQILNHLLDIEKNYTITQKFHQLHVTAQMRAVLIDWLALVASTLKLRKETIFLTSHIIDTFLSYDNIERNRFQLLGVTALYMACKQEEIYPPSTKDFCYITKKGRGFYLAYNQKQIVEFESRIIQLLDFQLNYPSAVMFLDAFQEKYNMDQKTFYLSQYILELSLLDEKFINYPASQLASSAIFLSNKLYKQKQKKWIYEESMIRPCAKDLCVLMFNADSLKQQNIRQKYASDKYLGVSQLKLQLI